MEKENKIIDITNSFVSIEDINLLKFMFPNFKVMYEPEMFPSSGIIFIGADKYVNWVKNCGMPYIIVRRNAEYDLNKREILLKVVFGKYGKTVPKYLDGIYMDIPEDEFIENIKIFWVTGRWMSKEVDNDTEYFNLVNAIALNETKLYSTAVSSLEEMSLSHLESKILNYMVKVLNGQIELKSKYGRIQQIYRDAKSHKVKEAATNYLEKNIWNEELRFINFLKNLC